MRCQMAAEFKHSQTPGDSASFYFTFITLYASALQASAIHAHVHEQARIYLDTCACCNSATRDYSMCSKLPLAVRHFELRWQGWMASEFPPPVTKTITVSNPTCIRGGSRIDCSPASQTYFARARILRAPKRGEGEKYVWCIWTGFCVHCRNVGSTNQIAVSSNQHN